MSPFLFYSRRSAHFSSSLIRFSQDSETRGFPTQGDQEFEVQFQFQKEIEGKPFDY
jgi:hypothetical protein